MLLLVGLTALTLWPPAQPWISPLAAFANGLAGLLVVWLLYEVTMPSEAYLMRAGVMTGGVLIVMYFGFAIFRIPPLMAMALPPAFQMPTSSTTSRTRAGAACSGSSTRWPKQIGRAHV